MRGKNELLGIFAVSLALCNTVILANKVDQTHSVKINKLPKQGNVFTEDKQSISVNVEQPEFTLKLKSNPTTGYAWFLREMDSTLVEPIKHTFVKPNDGLMGAPGYELWTFRMRPQAFIVPIQTTIRMVYARPWSGDMSTQLVFRISTQSKE